MPQNNQNKDNESWKPLYLDKTTFNRSKNLTKKKQIKRLRILKFNLQQLVTPTEKAWGLQVGKFILFYAF